MDFSVIDVETANSRPASICQVGIACFCDGVLSETWGELVNPEDSFLPFHTKIHGIGPQDVASARTWPELRPKIRSLLEDSTIASYTYFDRAATGSADARYGLPPIPVVDWVDTCKIARQVWPYLASYRLTSLAQHFRLTCRAHNAIDDARCAGQVLLLAAQASALDLVDLLYPTPRAVIRRKRRLRAKNGAESQTH